MRVLIMVAVILGLAQTAFGQDKVSFASNDTDLTRGNPTRLDGLLYRPDGDGPFSAIVLMHGCGGLYDRNGDVNARHDDWARRFHKLDYVVLHVDSFTPRGEREICTQKGRKIAPGRERARDAYGALLYLQGLAFVRPDRIGVMGWSNGGPLYGQFSIRLAHAQNSCPTAISVPRSPSIPAAAPRWSIGTVGKHKYRCWFLRAKRTTGRRQQPA